MDQYCSVFLKRFERLEKPEKIVTVFGALAATGLAAYCLNRVLFNGFTSKGREKDNYGTIPTPDGAVYYLGTERI